MRAIQQLFLLVFLALCLLAPSAQAREVYVTSSGASTVSVIETATNSAVATIEVGAGPADVAIVPNGSRAYVVNEDGNSVSVIDTATKVVVAGPIPVGGEPSGIAITPDGSRAYIANTGSDSVSVIDTGSNGVIETIKLPVEEEANAKPEGIAIAPDGATAFVAQRGGDVVLITTATNTVTGSIKTAAGLGPSRLSLTLDGARAFLTNANSSSLSVLSTITAGVLGSPVLVGANPTGVAVNPNGPRTYVAVKGANAVVAIETLTHHSIGSPIGGFASPSGIAIAPDGGRAYVANEVSASVTILDTLVNLPVGQIAAGAAPRGIAIVPDQGPSASFAVVPGKLAAGASVSFDASASSDPDGRVARYAWDFGDGESEVTSSPLVEHVYAKPGPRSVRLTVTDAEGCSTSLLFTGQTVSCNGGSRAVVSHSLTLRDTTPPEFGLGAARRQKLSRKVVVIGRCPQESCKMSARGFLASAVKGPKRVEKTKAKTPSASTELANGVERRLRLRLPAAAYRKARRVLLGGGRASIKIKASAADEAGNKRRRSLKVEFFLPAPQQRGSK